MNISVILAARLESTRLPQKLMLDICGMPMIEFIMKRLKRAKTTSQIILATTENTLNTVEEIAKRNNVDVFAGSEDDVLERYYTAAKTHKADIIVRATGDNPFIGIEALDLIVDEHIKNNADLSHFDSMPWGAGVEVISFSALECMAENAVDKFEREHITQHIYRNMSRFKILFPNAPGHLQMPNLRLTVDTKEDYDYTQEIIRHFSGESDIIGLKLSKIIKSVKNNELRLHKNQKV